MTLTLPCDKEVAIREPFIQEQLCAQTPIHALQTPIRALQTPIRMSRRPVMRSNTQSRAQTPRRALRRPSRALRCPVVRLVASDEYSKRPPACSIRPSARPDARAHPRRTSSTHPYARAHARRLGARPHAYTQVSEHPFESPAESSDSPTLL
ncbi:hypothetical protein CRG98_005128 [Punica granatum]|uniref:Uncharacterized protein n=1 Tax=Punica granatum TaxID=22663 RepID=A0A2I0L1C2_PUNGR|nr:hypothetical protein CRG98_005128 [Punica granatum]